MANAVITLSGRQSIVTVGAGAAAASATQAASSATLSQAWAESASAPGGSGTKSSKTWATESATSATASASSASSAAAANYSNSFFPGYADMAANEKAAADCITALQFFGLPAGKYPSLKYAFWKDSGTRANFTFAMHDDLDGTGVAEACTYSVASGADTWTTPRLIELTAVGGSGVTGSFIFTPPGAALTVNSASSTTAIYQRRRVNRRANITSTSRTTDIAAQAASGLTIRLQSGNVSAYFLGGNNSATGQQNAVFGYNAMPSITSAANNSAFGAYALYTTVSGQYNSAFGNDALRTSTGNSNSAFGYAAGRSLTTGTNNFFAGFQAGYTSTSASSSVFIGTRAGYGNSTGTNITAVGYEALFSATGSGATAFGDGAGYGVTTAQNFTAFGRRSAYAKTTGNDCTFAGYFAGYSGFVGEVNTGEGITAIGAYSFGHSTSGNYNTGCGRASGWYVTTGSNNAYHGYRCGYGNTIGSNNVSVGFYSGHNTSTGSRNTFLGAMTDTLVPSATGMTATVVAGAGLGIGVYSYRFTFVLDGVETALSELPLGATTTSGNQQVNLASIPTYTGPRTCSARRIYRTAVGGEHLLYLVAQISDNTTTTYSDNVADGSLGAQPVHPNDCIAIGYGASVMKSNQMVVGSITSRITEAYIGGGVDDTSPATLTVSGSNASGTNLAGATVRFRGGLSTGTAKGGSLVFAASPPGSSGSAPNAATDWMTLDGNGFLNLKETTSGAVATPAAGSINLFVEGGSLKFRNSAGTVKVVTAV